MREGVLLLLAAACASAQFAALCGPEVIDTAGVVDLSYHLGTVSGQPAIQFNVSWGGSGYVSIGLRAAGGAGMSGLDTYSFDGVTTTKVQDGSVNTFEAPTADAQQDAVLVQHTGTRVVFYRLLQTTDATDTVLTPGAAVGLAYATGPGNVFDGTWARHSKRGKKDITLLACNIPAGDPYAMPSRGVCPGRAPKVDPCDSTQCWCSNFKAKAAPAAASKHACAGQETCRSPLEDWQTSSVVAQINYYREQHGVCPASYSKAIERWVLNSPGYNETCTTGKLKHNTGSGYGENIMMKGSSGLGAHNFDPAAGVHMWYCKEEGCYTYPGSNGTTGHFTQVVWKTSREVGCGLCHLPGTGYTKVYMMCAFKEPGNMAGAYDESVLARGTAVPACAAAPTDSPAAAVDTPAPSTPNPGAGATPAPAAGGTPAPQANNSTPAGAATATATLSADAANPAATLSPGETAAPTAAPAVSTPTPNTPTTATPSPATPVNRTEGAAPPGDGEDDGAEWWVWLLVAVGGLVVAAGVAAAACMALRARQPNMLHLNEFSEFKEYPMTAPQGPHGEIAEPFMML